MMRTSRIAVIQKRAKRRMLALAVMAGICLGYSAIQLMADERPPLTSIEQLNKVPGVRTVGIRLTSKKSNAAIKASDANTSIAAVSSASTVSSELPPAVTSAVTSNAPTALPPISLLLPPPSLAPLADSRPLDAPLNASLPIADLMAPPSISTEEIPTLERVPDVVSGQDPEGDAIAQPPRMPENLTHSPMGKVLVKLSTEDFKSLSGVPTLPSTPPPALSDLSRSTHQTAASTTEASSNYARAESVDIRVLPPLSVGKTTVMQSLLINEVQPSQKPTAAEESNGGSTAVAADAAEPMNRVQMSLNNKTAVASADSDKLEVKPPKSRSPEIVKPKPTQITHTVVLAETAEIEEMPAHPSSPRFHLVDDQVTESKGAPIRNLVRKTIGLSATETILLSDTAKPKASEKVRASLNDTATVAPTTLELEMPPVPQPTAARVVSHPKPTGSTSASSSVEHVVATTPSMRKFASKNNSTSESSSTKVEIECQSVSTLDLHSPITAVAVENEEICQVIFNGRSVSIVGNTVGASMVQVWTEESNEIPYVVRVNVSQQWHRPNTKPTDIKDVKRAIEQSFPKSDINIVVDKDGTIEVRGSTYSEESASRILEIVRKLCLVPVRDKVSVSR